MCSTVDRHLTTFGCKHDTHAAYARVCHPINALVTTNDPYSAYSTLISLYITTLIRAVFVPIDLGLLVTILVQHNRPFVTDPQLHMTNVPTSLFSLAPSPTLDTLWHSTNGCRCLSHCCHMARIAQPLLHFVSPPTLVRFPLIHLSNIQLFLQFYTIPYIWIQGSTTSKFPFFIHNPFNLRLHPLTPFTIIHRTDSLQQFYRQPHPSNHRESYPSSHLPPCLMLVIEPPTNQPVTNRYTTILHPWRV